MSEQELAGLIKNHLDNFSTSFGNTITRSIDHLVAQHEKISQQTIDQDRRIDRLELLLENNMKQHSELVQTVKTATKNISEIALGQSNLDRDRRRFEEDIDTIYHKMNDWQNECTKKYESAAADISTIRNRVNKIYIVSGTISAVIGGIIGLSGLAVKVFF